MTTNVYQPGDHVRAATLSGVACWYVEDCEDHPNCAIVVMVGDDHQWHLDYDDLDPITPEEFCGSCGQIGCGHG